MLLNADELRATFKQRLIDYVKHYFIAREHTSRMYSISGVSCFADNLSNAPQLIFKTMITTELKRLTEIYQGVTDNELRFDELACTYGKISRVNNLDGKRIRDNERDAIADFITLADEIWLDKVANEINTKANTLEFEGKQKAANSMVNELSLTRYNDEFASNIKITARHAVCTVTIRRCQWDGSLEYDTNRKFQNIQKHLQLVALDTADATMIPSLKAMRTDDHKYVGALGGVYGDKGKNFIRMHKESMKLNFTHDSFEALMVWLMTYSTKDIKRLPCPS